MKKAHYACGTADHGVSRRRFLSGMSAMTAGGAMLGGLGSLPMGLAAQDMAKKGMRIVVFNMHGGLSQLESWDPKPGAKTGGPFRAIPTSVPGIHISELMPQTARQMHHLCLLRGVNTSEDDHGKGSYMMLTGRRQTPADEYPQIGSVAAKMLHDDQSGLPGHIVVTPGGGGARGNEAAYLGPKYSSIHLGGDKPPLNSNKPEAITADAEQRRHDFRRKVN